MDSTYYPHADAFERALRQVDVDAEVVRIPYFLVEMLTPERLRGIRNILKQKSLDRYLIFCPGLAEFFLEEADQLFMFSAYRGWYDPNKIRVVSHVWTPIRSPDTPDSLKWTRKPPLRVGFMGSSYSNSRLAAIASRLPGPVKRWLLSGSYLKNIGLLARLYQLGISLKRLNTFARVETLNVLDRKRQEYKNFEIEIVDTNGFGGSDSEKNRYITHLESMTYIVCPRGSENFSIRTYEALKYGRIPVIIDTDMVLPSEIDWDRVSIRVPYKDIGRIYDIILEDYNSRSEQDFIERQQTALTTMHDLQSMDWLTNLLRETANSHTKT